MAAKILVVDDDESLCELLRMHLAAAGYEVSTAPDAISAGYQVLNHPPDLILSDINMPHMDGFEFVAALKSDSRRRRQASSLTNSAAARRSTNRGMKSRMGRPSKRAYCSCTTWATRVGSTWV